MPFGGFLSFSPGPAGDKIRGAVEDTSSQADMTRAQAGSPGAVFEVGLRENRVMVGSRITVTLTPTGSLSHSHAWQSVCWLSSTNSADRRDSYRSKQLCESMGKARKSCHRSFLCTLKEPAERGFKK